MLVKPRSITQVIDRVLKYIEDNKNYFYTEKYEETIEKIRAVKKGSMYKSPELMYTSWDEAYSYIISMVLPVRGIEDCVVLSMWSTLDLCDIIRDELGEKFVEKYNLEYKDIINEY